MPDTKAETMKIATDKLYVVQNALGRLGEYKLPVRKSLEVAQLSKKVQDILDPIEKVRQKLFRDNGTVDSEGNSRKFDLRTESGLKGDAEHRTLMETVLELDFDITKKIVLPEITPFACDKCHHNMDHTLEIESNILASLMDFVTLA